MVLCAGLTGSREVPGEAGMMVRTALTNKYNTSQACNFKFSIGHN